MAGVAGDPYRLHDDALVAAHRAHGGGLADHRVAGLGPAQFDDGLGTVHGALLIGGGEDDQWCAQLFGPVDARRLDGEGEEGLHVRGPQAIQTLVLFGQLEGVKVPVALVIGDGVGVTGQHQAAGTLAQGGD